MRKEAREFQLRCDTHVREAKWKEGVVLLGMGIGMRRLSVDKRETKFRGNWKGPD